MIHCLQACNPSPKTKGIKCTVILIGDSTKNKRLNRKQEGFRQDIRSLKVRTVKHQNKLLYKRFRVSRTERFLRKMLYRHHLGSFRCSQVYLIEKG